MPQQIMFQVELLSMQLYQEQQTYQDSVLQLRKDHKHPNRDDPTVVFHPSKVVSPANILPPQQHPDTVKEISPDQAVFTAALEAPVPPPP